MQGRAADVAQRQAVGDGGGVGSKQMSIYVADGAQSSTLWKSVDPHNPAVLVGVQGRRPRRPPRRTA